MNYGIIVHDYISELYYIMILWDDTGLDYGIILRNHITEISHGFISQKCITALYYGILLRVHIKKSYHRIILKHYMIEL